MFSLSYDTYRPYEGLNLANQISQRLGVFDRKLEGSHATFHSYTMGIEA